MGGLIDAAWMTTREEGGMGAGVTFTGQAYSAKGEKLPIAHEVSTSAARPFP